MPVAAAKVEEDTVSVMVAMERAGAEMVRAVAAKVQEATVTVGKVTAAAKA